MSGGDDSVHLVLSRDEALVLFEWIARCDNGEGPLFAGQANSGCRG